MTSNERAYELLRWQSLAPLADFDDLLPYVKTWQEASDAALDQFDKEHQTGSSPELTAFRELERLGVYTQNDYYSPSKAANGFYTKHLRAIRERTNRRDQKGFAQGSRTFARSPGNRRRAN